jgi:hypothetical protein
VVAVALAVAALATFFPAVRAAHTSTVGALADAARQPRRRGWLIARSARLPVPLLLAIRVAARRPRRIVLCVLSIAVTVSGIVALLFAHATLGASQFAGSSGLANPDLFDVGFAARTQRLDQVLLTVTIMLVALAAVNAIFITRATVQDSSHASAVTRALGATPQQVTAGAVGGAGPPCHGRRHSRHSRRFRLLRSREPRREREPAASLVADRRGGRHRDRRGRAHLHSRPHRRPPPGSGDPAIRNRLTLATTIRR